MVMYIIMAYVEFRLPPNSQAGRRNDLVDDWGVVEMVQRALWGR